MPQPETKLRGHFLRYGEIIADERPRDYYDQRPEQYVHAQLLIFGVAAVDDGRHEQAGGKKGGRDPQHRALHMPCARQRVGKPLRDIDRSEEHTSELQSLMRISYAVFCLKKKTNTTINYTI